MDLTKSRNLCWQKKNLQQNPHVLDDGASGFASGECWTSNWQDFI